MRICRSQYFQDKLSQKINKQGVLIREGVGKIENINKRGAFYKALQSKIDHCVHGYRFPLAN